jgi:hypothetical protein
LHVAFYAGRRCKHLLALHVAFYAGRRCIDGKGKKSEE